MGSESHQYSVPSDRVKDVPALMQRAKVDLSNLVGLIKAFRSWLADEGAGSNIDQFQTKAARLHLDLNAVYRNQLEEALRCCGDAATHMSIAQLYHNTIHQVVKGFAIVIASVNNEHLRKATQFINEMLESVERTINLSEEQRRIESAIHAPQCLYDLMILARFRVHLLLRIPFVLAPKQHRVEGQRLEMTDPIGNIQLATSLPGEHQQSQVNEGAIIADILANLVANSRRAIGKNNEGAIILSCQKREKHWWFSVGDSGPGFAPEVLARIQRGEYVGSTSGTGMYLALAHRYISGNGGQMSYGSLEPTHKTNPGAVVDIFWPHTQKESASSPSTPPKERRRKSRQ